ncbi:MAG: hypothetical protein ACQERZ_00810 [Fusobacteriota bacterium]
MMLVQASITRPSLASNQTNVTQTQKRLEETDVIKSKVEVQKSDSKKARKSKLDFNLQDQVKNLATKLEKTQQYTKSASTVIATNLLQGNSIEVSA